ncbi:hypothetical protein ABMA27_009140 [Loxostege sticticalis]|uniref:Transposase n=1 Tax=Loxostege sticticalis TaxID=481309 RepID=A0ABR3HAA5_LOXSC
MAVTGHFINKETLEFYSILIQCAAVEGNHTGERIADELRVIFAEWAISDKVNFIVTDNAANMRAAARILEISHFGCFAHKLNLIVQTALADDAISQTIAKVRHIPTRWNSTYQMLERFASLQEALRATIPNLNEDLPVIPLEEWNYLEKCAAILKPFEEITNELSSATATVASVIPLIYTLKNTLEAEKIKEDTSENFKLMVTKMIHNISGRFQDIENNKIYTIATYLDPRYKLKFFTEITKEQVQSETLRILGCSRTSQDEGPSYTTNYLLTSTNGDF